MKNEFGKLSNLVARNIKLYFKDKLVFFVSLITPLILVVLFLTFLKGIYESSLLAFVPEGVEVSQNIINAFTGGWLFSSIMATSCITVAFCSNMMVTDKLNKVSLDFQITATRPATVKVSYAIANFCTTMIICLVVFVISLVYLSIIGWFLSFVDILLILCDMVLCCMMGTLLASIIGNFISSQGALSAVCTMVSSMYGFLCGAYMPISQFGIGMQRFVSFIPGTYATVLFRQYYMGGVLNELGKTFPPEAIDGLRKGFDGSFDFFGHELASWQMFLIVALCVIAFLGIYILISSVKLKKHKKRVKTVKTAS